MYVCLGSKLNKKPRSEAEQGNAGSYYPVLMYAILTSASL